MSIKVVNVTFTDVEHKKLSALKGNRTWKQALIDGCKNKGGK